MTTAPSIEINETFSLALRFVSETSEDIFLTGKAGTGKTTFLKYLKDHCAKNIIVAAPTGVAAINAGGVTLHSLFQLPFHPFLPTRSHRDELLGKLKFNNQRLQLLRKMELLIIDEISMVRADVMDAIDTILRSVRKNFETPFGGVQLLCIGDLYQLPPVAQHQEWSILQEYYASPFFFDSMAIREQIPLLIELTHIYRQKEASFVRLLNKVRNNEMDADDFEDLHMRYDESFRPGPGENFITLTSHNKQADLINTQEIEKILKPIFLYKADVVGEFPEHIYPAEAELALKEGAQVMFLKNDAVQKRYFNGKIGIVRELQDEKVVVECDGNLIEVAKESWENSRYVLNRADGKLEQEITGVFTQYPLRLAWAITIHKSQGLTFEKVMIDAGAAFSSGQVYVALSRCTSLEGIQLLSKIPSAAILSNDHVIKGQQALTHRGSLAERFEGARQVFTQQLMQNIFSFEQIDHSLNHLLFFVKKHSEKLNAPGIDWAVQLQEQFLIKKSVGLNFIGHIYTMMKDEAVIEKNVQLQQRIADGAHFFEKHLEDFLNSIKRNPMVTEHRDAGSELNESLQEAALSVYTALYYIQFCKKPFEVGPFLKHKLNFSQPRFNLNCYASGKKQNESGILNPELFETLKRWRDMACEESGLAIYMVANLNTLKELSTYLPLTKKDLMKISGFGKAKVEKYGDEILAAIESYCGIHNIPGNMDEMSTGLKKEAKKSAAKPDTKSISLGIFKEGKSLKEVAELRNLALGTIESHLAHYVANGEVKIEALLEPELIKKISDLQLEGVTSLQQIKDKLPATVTYGEIRIALAANKFTASET